MGEGEPHPLLVGTFAEEIVRVLKFIILLVVKIDSAYQFD